jgi:hypothetical protein
VEIEKQRLMEIEKQISSTAKNQYNIKKQVLNNKRSYTEKKRKILLKKQLRWQCNSIYTMIKKSKETSKNLKESALKKFLSKDLSSKNFIKCHNQTSYVINKFFKHLFDLQDKNSHKTIDFNSKETGIDVYVMKLLYCQDGHGEMNKTQNKEDQSPCKKNQGYIFNNQQSEDLLKMTNLFNHYYETEESITSQMLPIMLKPTLMLPKDKNKGDKSNDTVHEDDFLSINDYHNLLCMIQDVKKFFENLFEQHLKSTEQVKDGEKKSEIKSEIIIVDEEKNIKEETLSDVINNLCPSLGKKINNLDEILELNKIHSEIKASNNFNKKNMETFRKSYQYQLNCLLECFSIANNDLFLRCQLVLKNLSYNSDSNLSMATIMIAFLDLFCHELTILVQKEKEKNHKNIGDDCLNLKVLNDIVFKIRDNFLKIVSSDKLLTSIEKPVLTNNKPLNLYKVYDNLIAILNHRQNIFAHIISNFNHIHKGEDFKKLGDISMLETNNSAKNNIQSLLDGMAEILCLKPVENSNLFINNFDKNQEVVAYNDVLLCTAKNSLNRLMAINFERKKIIANKQMFHKIFIGNGSWLSLMMDEYLSSLINYKEQNIPLSKEEEAKIEKILKKHFGEEKKDPMRSQLQKILSSELSVKDMVSLMEVLLTYNVHILKDFNDILIGKFQQKENEYFVSKKENIQELVEKIQQINQEVPKENDVQSVNTVATNNQLNDEENSPAVKIDHHNHKDLQQHQEQLKNILLNKTPLNNIKESIVTYMMKNTTVDFIIKNFSSSFESIIKFENFQENIKAIMTKSFLHFSKNNKCWMEDNVDRLYKIYHSWINDNNYYKIIFDNCHYHDLAKNFLCFDRDKMEQLMGDGNLTITHSWFLKNQEIHRKFTENTKQQQQKNKFIQLIQKLKNKLYTKEELKIFSANHFKDFQNNLKNALTPYVLQIKEKKMFDMDEHFKVFLSQSTFIQQKEKDIIINFNLLDHGLEYLLKSMESEEKNKTNNKKLMEMIKQYKNKEEVNINEWCFKDVIYLFYKLNNYCEKYKNNNEENKKEEKIITDANQIKDTYEYDKVIKGIYDFLKIFYGTKILFNPDLKTVEEFKCFEIPCNLKVIFDAIADQWMSLIATLNDNNDMEKNFQSLMDYLKLIDMLYLFKNSPRVLIEKYFKSQKNPLRSALDSSYSQQKHFIQHVYEEAKIHDLMMMVEKHFKNKDFFVHFFKDTKNNYLDTFTLSKSSSILNEYKIHQFLSPYGQDIYHIKGKIKDSACPHFYVNNQLHIDQKAFAYNLSHSNLLKGLAFKTDSLLIEKNNYYLLNMYFNNLNDLLNYIKNDTMNFIIDNDLIEAIRQYNKDLKNLSINLDEPTATIDEKFNIIMNLAAKTILPILLNYFQDMFFKDNNILKYFGHNINKLYKTMIKNHDKKEEESNVISESIEIYEQKNQSSKMINQQIQQVPNYTLKFLKYEESGEKIIEKTTMSDFSIEGKFQLINEKTQFIGNQGTKITFIKSDIQNDKQQGILNDNKILENLFNGLKTSFNYQDGNNKTVKKYKIFLEMLNKMLGYEFSYMKAYFTLTLDFLNNYQNTIKTDTQKVEKNDEFMRYLINTHHKRQQFFNPMVIFHQQEQEKNKIQNPHFFNNKFSLDDKMFIMKNLMNVQDNAMNSFLRVEEKSGYFLAAMINDIKNFVQDHCKVLLDLLLSINKKSNEKLKTGSIINDDFKEIVSLLYEKIEKFQNQLDILKAMIKLLIALFYNEDNNLINENSKEFRDFIEKEFINDTHIPILNQNLLKILVKESIVQYQTQIKNILEFKFENQRLPVTEDHKKSHEKLLKDLFGLLIFLNGAQGVLIANNVEFFKKNQDMGLSNYSTNEINLIKTCQNILLSENTDGKVFHLVKILNFSCNYVKPSLRFNEQGIFTEDITKKFEISNYNCENNNIAHGLKKMIREILHSCTTKI